MFSLKKKLNDKSFSAEVPDLKERLFFHDLINHTHGLVLFLHQKELQKAGIDNEDLKVISNEIKSLQSLIRDHYDFKHKNLVQTFDWVPFSYAKLAFQNMSVTYLMNKKIEVTYNIEQESENLIYYPSFYRILNNLIKNISESNSSSVEFEFIVDEHGLQMISKNIMLIKNEKDLPEHLARVILSEKPPQVEGLGLESIHHMAEENGGSFSFEITNSVWINKLFLPTKKNKSDKKAA